MGTILLSMIAIGVNFDFHSVIDAGASTVSKLATLGNATSVGLPAIFCALLTGSCLVRLALQAERP
eukprot:2001633-Prymnesium_polylepis.1